MWPIYCMTILLIAGVCCYPTKETITATDETNCSIVITRFGDPVENLKVKWNSTISLVCNVSCDGPGPHPALTWFIKNSTSERGWMNIDKMFHPHSFDTFPTTFHRRQELVVKHFGPDQATAYKCKGILNGVKSSAKVNLIGTDCLDEYEFRCSDNLTCIGRSQICDYYTNCPDGDDESECAYQLKTTSTEAPQDKTTRESYSIDYDEYNSTESETTDMNTTSYPSTTDFHQDTTTVGCSADMWQCRKTFECIPKTEYCDGLPNCEDRTDELECEIGSTCSEGRRACLDGECISEYFACDGINHCQDSSDETFHMCGTDEPLKLPIIGENAGDEENVILHPEVTTAKSTPSTTPFDYDYYIDAFFRNPENTN